MTLQVNIIKTSLPKIKAVFPVVAADRGPEGAAGELSSAAPQLQQAQTGAGAPAENSLGKRAGHSVRLHLTGRLLFFVFFSFFVFFFLRSVIALCSALTENPDSMFICLSEQCVLLHFVTFFACHY